MNPWSGISADEWQREQFPETWRDRILESYPDADFYNSGPLPPALGEHLQRGVRQRLA